MWIHYVSPEDASRWSWTGRMSWRWHGQVCTAHVLWLPPSSSFPSNLPLTAPFLHSSWFHVLCDWENHRLVWIDPFPLLLALQARVKRLLFSCPCWRSLKHIVPRWTAKEEKCYFLGKGRHREVEWVSERKSEWERERRERERREREREREREKRERGCHCVNECACAHQLHW